MPDVDIDDGKLNCLGFGSRRGLNGITSEVGFKPEALVKESLVDCLCRNLGFGSKNVLVVFSLEGDGG